MEEVWRAIEEKPGYWVSNLGRVRNHNDRIIEGSHDKDGYLRMTMWNRYNTSLQPNRRKHSLVAEAFIGPCHPGLVINHKNGVKDDNRAENLEYVTISQNAKHGYDALGRKGHRVSTPGEANSFSRFKDADIREMRRLAAKGMRHAHIAKKFKTAQTVVSRIVNRLSWAHLK